ncbi:MAG: hypothetical protein WCS72_18170 [Deltaproteobacteria bacterium]
MIQRLLMVMFALSMAACGHKMQVTSQDFATGTFVVCGKKGIANEELSQKALGVCPGGPTIIKCGPPGFATSTSPTTSGMVPAAGSSSQNCCQYQCPQAAPAAAPSK